MQQQILTDIVILDKNTKDIEQKLKNKFNGEIIRWAIVDIIQDKLKICCSYKI
jgi:hypothetical protein